MAKSKAYKLGVEARVNLGLRQKELESCPFIFLAREQRVDWYAGWGDAANELMGIERELRAKQDELLAAC